MFTLFRLIGWRNLLLGLMAIALLLLIRRQFFQSDQQQLRVQALFSQVDFVQELRLVTYYTEELLQIGGYDDLQQEIRILEMQQADRERDSLRLISQATAARHLDQEVRAELLTLGEELRRYRDHADRIKDSLRAYPRGWRRIRRTLENDPNALGREVRAWHRHWQNLERSPEAVDYQRLIEGQVAKVRAHLETREDSLRDEVDRMKNRLRVARNSLRAAEENRNKNDAELSQLRRELRQIRINLQARQSELLAIQEQEANQEIRREPPKLLAVVATGVSARTDLRNLRYEVRDDTVLHFFCLPPAEIDPRVAMELAGEEARFSLLSNRLLGLFGQRNGFDSDRESVYLQVYREMKVALEAMRQNVVLDALRRGILTEADQLARDYLTRMGYSLGFARVTFGEPCEPRTPTPALAASGSPVVDSLAQQIGQASP